jgi:hypothetical protein
MSCPLLYITQLTSSVLCTIYTPLIQYLILTHVVRHSFNTYKIYTPHRTYNIVYKTPSYPQCHNSNILYVLQLLYILLYPIALPTCTHTHPHILTYHHLGHTIRILIIVTAVQLLVRGGCSVGGWGGGWG